MPLPTVIENGLAPVCFKSTADLNAARNEHVLPQDAALTQERPLGDVTEMPDLRSPPNRARLVNTRRGMRIVFSVTHSSSCTSPCARMSRFGNLACHVDVPLVNLAIFDKEISSKNA